MPSDIASVIPLTSIDSADLVTGYLPINPDGLPFPCYQLQITNNSNVDVMISIDGTNPYIFVPTLSTVYFPGQNNSQPGNHKTLWPKGLVLSAGETAGEGLIYLMGFYNK